MFVDFLTFGLTSKPQPEVRAPTRHTVQKAATDSKRGSASLGLPLEDGGGEGDVGDDDLGADDEVEYTYERDLSKLASSEACVG
jgi:hypothetical protein